MQSVRWDNSSPGSHQTVEKRTPQDRSSATLCTDSRPFSPFTIKDWNGLPDCTVTTDTCLCRVPKWYPNAPHPHKHNQLVDCDQRSYSYTCFNYTIFDSQKKKKMTHALTTRSLIHRKWRRWIFSVKIPPSLQQFDAFVQKINFPLGSEYNCLFFVFFHCSGYVDGGGG